MTAAPDDSGDSFLQWVKQLVGEDAAAALNENRPDVEGGADESRWADSGQDQVLPADAMRPFPELPDDLPVPDTQNSDDGENPSMANLPLFSEADATAIGDGVLVSDAPLRAEADISGARRSLPADDTPLPERAENSAAGSPSNRTEKMDPGRPEIDPLRHRADGIPREALSGLQQAAANPGEPVENLQRPLSPGHSDQAYVTDEPVRFIRPGRGKIDPVKENPLVADSQGEMSKKGLENTRTGDPGKPVAIPVEKEHPAPDRFIGQGVTPEPSGTAETRKPATFHQAVTNQPAGDPESLASVVSDKHAASPEDPATNFRGGSDNHRTRRNESTDSGEDGTQKGQASESGKGGPLDAARLHSSLQDAPKSMVNPAEKLAAGQPAAVKPEDGEATKPFHATVMDQIVDKAAVRSINGRSEIQIQLKPDFLGKVQMNIVADKDQLAVRIVADQSVVKDIIETHIHHLKAELQNQGLAVEKIEVLVSSDGDPHPGREQPSQTFKQHASPNGGRQQYDDRDPEERERPQYSNDNDPDSDRDGINYFA